MSDATTPFVIDRQRENEAILRAVERHVPDRGAALRLFGNVRRVASRRWQRSPNWEFAMQIYGVGSTYAYAICRRIGLDPEAKNAARTGGPDA